MPQQPSASIENNFTAGLKTEFTGLNFPENAATDADNVVFDRIGNVYRRLGIDYELNSTAAFSSSAANKAQSTYLWTNAGGDGNTQLLVEQLGATLYFYKVTAATVASPLTNKLLVSTVNLSSFLVVGSSRTVADIECQYSDGNGYLFVYHPSLESFYCSFASDTISASSITLKARDFLGVPEAGVDINYRPGALSQEHLYNLTNQGWTAGAAWTGECIGSTVWGPVVTGSKSFVLTAQSTGTVTNGDVILISARDSLSPISLTARATVTSFSYPNMTLSVSSVSNPAQISAVNVIYFTKSNTGYINTWFSAVGNYPSNADVWWNFKNSSDVFDPATTLANVTVNTGYAPKGHTILSPFNQTRSTTSGISGITDISTFARPRTGTWFQGRVWYAGVDDSKAASGTAPFYTWSESIYFSQIITDSSQFGFCYQTNDPTSQDLFNLLPTDGGVINIQGCGSIYKLFPIQNGMLVFAANGIWFITGSQGIGFTASDYTITKISNIRSLSSTSFVNVQGLPMFWNEEGIYTVTPAQQGLGLQVQSLTFNTIDTLYADIPVSSKQFARGDYNPIEYIVQWVYRSTPATTVTQRYQFDKVLCFNTQTKAFYTYTLPTSNGAGLIPFIHGINYIPDYGANSPTGMFKYLTSVASAGSNYFRFSDEHDEGYKDWQTDGGGIDFSSYFETGYKIRGQAQRRWQPGYIYMFSDVTDPVSYRIQAKYDYATSGNSGRWSSQQLITIDQPYYAMAFRRHRLRGQGLVMQFKVSSVTGEPFNFIGWSIWETSNTGV